MVNLLTLEDWQKAKEDSNSRPVLIFKHSTACHRSTKAFNILTGAESSLPPIYKVVVQENREISDLIETELEVKHETPQLIVLSKGESLFSVSHEAVEPEAVEPYLEV